MLGKNIGNHTQDYCPDYVVFDLETTGTSPRTESIIEISALKVRGGKVVDEFSSLINPLRHIPERASAVNGITDDMVADAPELSVVLEAFFRFIGNDVLVGHNIKCFDMKYIYRDARNCFNAIPDNDYVDTLIISRKALPELDHHRLSDLCDYYNISTKGAHRALADCYMNQKVYEYMVHGSQSTMPMVKVCPKCGCRLKRRTGPYGEFLGCGGFPRCRYTERISCM